MIAASRHALPERFVHSNAAMRHSLNFFIFVQYDRPCRIGMVLLSSNNGKQPCLVFYQSVRQGAGGGDQLRSFFRGGAGWTGAGVRSGAAWTAAAGGVSSSHFNPRHAQPLKDIPIIPRNSKSQIDVFLMVPSFIGLFCSVTHPHQLPNLQNHRFNNLYTG